MVAFALAALRLVVEAAAGHVLVMETESDETPIWLVKVSQPAMVVHLKLHTTAFPWSRLQIRHGEPSD